jgi:hypothetical protein
MGGGWRCWRRDLEEWQCALSDELRIVHHFSPVAKVACSRCHFTKSTSQHDSPAPTVEALDDNPVHGIAADQCFCPFYSI